MKNANKGFLQSLREATRLVRTKGPAEATVAIQRALKGATAAASPAPPSAPETRKPQIDRTTGEFLAGSFANHSGARDYKLYVPSRYRGQALPLVVMLHGCTQSPDDFAAGTRMNAAAELEPCFVLYPAQAHRANHANCWNWFERHDQKRDQGEPSIIADMTREIVGKYRVDPRRVYVAGLSAGGAMAVVMKTTYPELYAAVGVHSGLAYGAAHDVRSALQAMKGRPGVLARGRRQRATAPVIVFHGDSDQTVHPCNGDEVLAQWQSTPDSSESGPKSAVERGSVPNGHSYTRTVYKDGAGRVSAEHWVVHGAGHAWSGGSPDGSYVDPAGPDATREMLRFFLGLRQASREDAQILVAAGDLG